MTEAKTASETNYPQITELTKTQRRVLGVLLEKAFTTQEYYPLTLKAVTTGCNQKSNRHPIYNYSEDAVLDVIDELREIGLAAVIHTESGRTERYRHYMRRRFTFSEPQLAILTELLLRGRQSIGELRARASRMVSIDGLNQLRQELSGLMEINYNQISGSLERRGVEIDHNLYLPSEGMQLTQDALETSRPVNEAQPAVALERLSEPPPTPANVSDVAVQSNEQLTPRLSTLETTMEQLRLENQQLRDDVDSFKEEFRQLSDRLEDLRSDLGG